MFLCRVATAGEPWASNVTYEPILRLGRSRLGYKDSLLASLVSSGWELVRIETQHPEWWCDEYWVIWYVRESCGLEVFIFFVVDPQWVRPRKPGQGVWQIAAIRQMLRDWLEAGRGITTISMSKRRWDEKLCAFVEALTAHRREQRE